MAHVEPSPQLWTVLDIPQTLGPIPCHRVHSEPPPGAACEADAVAALDRDGRPCELIDGTLLEKTVGYYEAFLAFELGLRLAEFVRPRNLGIVLGADALIRLRAGQLRLPDVSFTSWARLPGGQVPKESIGSAVPDLAVEIVSASNTRQELERKLRDYFAAGVRLVWYVYPERQEVVAYSSPEASVTRRAGESLDGAPVLPGFALDLAAFFAARPSADPPGE